MNRIYIDGIDYTDWVSGLDDLTESYSFDDNNAIEIGQTSEIVMHGLGYNYWKSIFVDDTCNSINNEYEVRVRADCGVDLFFILKAQGANFDFKACKVRMVFNAKDPRSEQLRILQKSYFHKKEEGFFNHVDSLPGDHRPKLTYVKELTWLNKIIGILYVFVVLPLIKVVNFIIGIINAIDDLIGTGRVDKIDDEALDDDVIGAGEFTPTYYISDIIEFWCNKAGLNFKSTIWKTDPYQNVVLWSQQIKKGIELEDCEVIHHDPVNAANIDTVELLNLLNPVFNSQWRIIGNDLFFERKDFYDTTRISVFDLSDQIAQNRIIGEVNIRFDNTDNCAQFKGDYLLDSIDTQGNRAITLYSEIKEYNENLQHKNRKGKCEPIIEFGAARFTDDIYQNDFTSLIWNQSNLLLYKIGSQVFTHSLVLFNETAQLYKLIEIDQNPQAVRQRGKCKLRMPIKRQIKNPNRRGGLFADIAGTWEYNYNLWFSELYKRFHYISDPDLIQRYAEIPEITWQPQNFCEAVTFMRANMLNTKISSIFGDGNIGSFEINYKTCTIKLKEIKFKCDGSNN